MNRMTSQTDPIRVDFLPVPAVGLRGRIGLTFAPGKGDGRWHRDLGADIERLHVVWRTHLLVSILEDQEMVALGIAELPTAVEGAGMRSCRVSIPDGGVPSSVETLRDAVGEILAAAAGGGNVVVHCRGGLGRTGLVVACSLVALGADASTAIATVRAARPGAVETAGQEQFVERFAATDRGTASTLLYDAPTVPTLSSFRGCLLGGALGDALGYPVEFEGSATAILREHGVTGPKKLAYAGQAVVSDDTQMTLFVAEGIIRAVQRLRDRGVSSVIGSIQRSLVRWYATQSPVPETGPCFDDRGWLFGERRLHERRAPGNTCMSAMRAQVSLA